MGAGLIRPAGWPDWALAQRQGRGPPSLPRAHREFTETAPRVHRELTESSPRVHREFTESSPRVHREFTEISPRVHRGFTESSPRVHRECTEPSHVVTLLTCRDTGRPRYESSLPNAIPGNLGTSSKYIRSMIMLEQMHCIMEPILEISKNKNGCAKFDRTYDEHHYTKVTLTRICVTFCLRSLVCDSWSEIFGLRSLVWEL